MDMKGRLEGKGSHRRAAFRLRLCVRVGPVDGRQLHFGRPYRSYQAYRDAPTSFLLIDVV